MRKESKKVVVESKKKTKRIIILSLCIPAILAVVIYTSLFVRDYNTGAKIVNEYLTEQIQYEFLNAIKEYQGEPVEAVEQKTCVEVVEASKEEFRTTLAYSYVCRKAADFDNSMNEVANQIDEMTSK